MDDLVKRLLTLDPGWASVAEITCTLEPDDPEARSELRRQLRSLVNTGPVRSIYVRHRGEPMLCIYLGSDLLS